MIEEIYLLSVHEPYESHDHPVPINATIVHVKTLLHRQVPQPDGGRMYRCLTEFPGRSDGCIVPGINPDGRTRRRSVLAARCRLGACRGSYRPLVARPLL
jgi:hypothetical protein